MVPEEQLREVIPLLYADMVCSQAGARQLGGLTGIPTVVPRLSAGTVSYWLGSETTAITVADVTLQQLSMTPKTVANLSVASALVLQTSVPSIEQMVRDDMAMQLALAFDKAALVGAASGPTGLSATAGVGTSTMTDPPTPDEWINMVAVVRAANGLKGKLAWVMSNADFIEAQQVKSPVTTSGTIQDARQVLFSPMQTNILGYQALVSTQLTDGQNFFGNWDDMLLAQWGGLRIDTTNALGFLSGTTHLRTMMFCDVGIRRPASFVKGA